MSTVRSLGGIYKSGTLGGTSKVVSLTDVPLPFSVQLNSTDSTRAIEFSCGGTVYWSPAVTVTATPCLVVAATAPVTHIRLTGLSADTYVVV